MAILAFFGKKRINPGNCGIRETFSDSKIIFGTDYADYTV